MALPLVNAVSGASGTSLIFFVDPKGKAIKQYRAPPGFETTADDRPNYQGPTEVKVFDDAARAEVPVFAHGLDIAAVTYATAKDEGKTYATRIIYTGLDDNNEVSLREIWREVGTDVNNNGLWRAGALTTGNPIKTELGTPISACVEHENRQLRVYYFAPQSKSQPSVAFLDQTGKWHNRVIFH